MWPGGACFEGGVEVELKPRIKHHTGVGYFRNVNLVISFGVNLAKGVFIEKVIRDDEATLIFGQSEIVWAGGWSQVENVQNLRGGWFGSVEHHNLSCLVQGDEEPAAITRRAHQLG